MYLNLLTFVLNIYKNSYNPPLNVKVATRLGHVKGYFIYPYQEVMKDSNIKLFSNDKGFQKLIDSFQSKGTLEGYSKKSVRSNKRSTNGNGYVICIFRLSFI